MTRIQNQEHIKKTCIAQFMPSFHHRSQTCTTPSLRYAHNKSCTFLHVPGWHTSITPASGSLPLSAPYQEIRIQPEQAVHCLPITYQASGIQTALICALASTQSTAHAATIPSLTTYHCYIQRCGQLTLSATIFIIMFPNTCATLARQHCINLQFEAMVVQKKHHFVICNISMQA